MWCLSYARTIWVFRVFFFFNDTATTEIYTLSLHDALPIYQPPAGLLGDEGAERDADDVGHRQSGDHQRDRAAAPLGCHQPDRKSTRLNSSHANISYAVFCLKKKKRVSYL